MSQTQSELKKQLGQERMGQALDGIDEAQRALGDALEHLQTIADGTETWGAGLVLHARIKGYWHQVNQLYQRLARSGGPCVDEFTLNNELERRSAEKKES